MTELGLPAIAAMRDQLLTEIKAPDQAKLKMRQVIQALFPQILQLLEYGYTFEDISRIASKSGVELKANTLKTYYYELRRTEEMTVIIEAQKRITQQAILSLGNHLGRVLPEAMGRQINHTTAEVVTEKIDDAVEKLSSAIKETPKISPPPAQAETSSSKRVGKRNKRGAVGAPPSLDEITEILDKGLVLNGHTK